MRALSEIAADHLLLRLQPLNRALHRAVERQGLAASRLLQSDITALCVTADQVEKLLSDVESIAAAEVLDESPASFMPEETVRERDLRRECADKDVILPLDRLAKTKSLTCFEQEAVLLCAAPEVDRSYDRIYAYILDDLNRRNPCVELLCAVTARSHHENLARRQVVSRFGKLRRYGILHAHGESPNELRQELRIRPEVLAFLLGASGDPTALLRDPAEVEIPGSLVFPPETSVQKIRQLGEAIRCNAVSVVGVWGPRNSGHDEVALGIAREAGCPLRQWRYAGTNSSPASFESALLDALRTSAALRSALWLQTDCLIQPNDQAAAGAADMLAASDVPLILTGTNPWRPTPLLAQRSYAQIELTTPSHSTRTWMWNAYAPEAGIECPAGLASRFRMGPAEMRAAARVARTEALLSEDSSESFEKNLEHACGLVARKHTHNFATPVIPKRGPDDLVLPPAVFEQVMEVAHFFRAWPAVSESWGFGRLTTGEGGVKALFTGVSGTGKTLAAEVIAGLLQMPLLKVDLARIVSKWVGETEKHLESAFREAEDSHSVLFFDEADALFGKRGDVQQGVDRYANLEVSYLLQRLEDHHGLVILASNLRDNIDSAFTRRFHVVVHFPRPQAAERRRIWQIAFPAGAPLEDGIDFDVLSRLDMTGAAIVSAANASALMAVNDGSDTITTSYVIRAIARQFGREARILTPGDLGRYAGLL